MEVAGEWKDAAKSGQVMVDLIYELGANAQTEQRQSIGKHLAGAAAKTGNQEVPPCFG